MKQRRKARIAALVSAILLLTGCGQTTPEQAETSEQAKESLTAPIGQNEGLQQATEKLLEQWEAYLTENEALHQYADWVFDYTENFLADQNWETLLKARGACLSLQNLIRQAEVSPELDLTAEEREVLREKGVELEGAELELAAFQQNIQEMNYVMENLDNKLHDEIFLQEGFESLKPWVAVQRSIQNNRMEQLWVSTNFLLLQTEREDLWDEIYDSHGYLSCFRGDWIDDQDQLTAHATKLLDACEGFENDLNALIGQSEYLLALVKDAVNTGDYSELSEHLRTYEGASGLFPMPPWMGFDSTMSYLMNDPEQDQKRPIRPEEPLDEIPAAFHCVTAKVPLEEVEKYEAALQAMGLPAYPEWEEEQNRLKIISTAGECNLLIEWTEEETTVYLSDPVGCLMPQLYLLALIQN